MLRNRTGTFPSRFSVSVLLQNGITLDEDNKFSNLFDYNKLTQWSTRE